MPPTLARLKKRSEFLRVARGGRKWVASGLILQSIECASGENGGGETAGLRVGFTVSLKVGNAVQRNRARRRLCAVVEQVMENHAKEGRDYVLIGRRTTLKRPFEALLGDLTTALKKLDAYYCHQELKN